MDPTPLQPQSPPRSKRRKLLLAFLLVLLALIVVLDTRRRHAESQLEEVSLSPEQVETNAEENRELAQEIVEKVRRHIYLPPDIQPTVATIVDVFKLRQRNQFYNKAENGDFLIVTSSRAILYDPDADIILDVVPVQIEEPRAQQ